MKVKCLVSQPLLVFLVTLTVFLAAPVSQSLDSRYCLMVSQNLVDNGSFRLNRAPGVVEALPFYPFKSNFEVVNNDLYYLFPNGSSLLSVPYVAAMNRFGLNLLPPDGFFDIGLEIRMQRGLASILMAGLAAMVFTTARLWLPPGWSWLVALAAAFGTQVFSIASRGLWSHTWGIFLLSLALYVLARQAQEKRPYPCLLATLLSWGYFVRPTFSISILAVTALMLVKYRGAFLRYGATGASWLALFIGYSWFTYGKLLPTYYAGNRLGSQTFGTALVGNLVSPSRGVLIFSPVILVVIYLAIRFRRFLRNPSLAATAGAACVGHLLVVSTFAHWWAGHSYGPRFMTDVVPWLVILAILGIDAMRAALRAGEGVPADPVVGNWERRAVLAAGALLLAFSIFTHGRGAFSNDTHLWNVTPNVDLHPEKIWDWGSPQFMTGLR